MARNVTVFYTDGDGVGRVLSVESDEPTWDHEELVHRTIEMLPGEAIVRRYEVNNVGEVEDDL